MSANRGSTLFSRRWWRACRWLVLVLALAAIGLVDLRIGELLITQTNTSDKHILGGDQKQNIKLALQAREDLSPDFSKGVTEPLKDWFPHRTDGVINPLWPWMAAWLADKDQVISEVNAVTDSDRVLFNRGRWFHVGWTLGILLILGLACARVFSLGSTLNVVLLTGFGALLPRAAYFQPEPVYFVLFLITWLACLFALHKNSLWMHGLIGFFGGLAYLAKGSVQPLLMVYVAVSTLRWAWGWIEARRSRPEGGTTLWLRRNHWIALFLMSFCFLMTAGPRLSYAARVFGAPFHSFPAYMMWLDNFEDGYAWMGEHNSRAKLEAEPKELRPSFKNYAATHTGEQMRQRLIDGTSSTVMGLLWPGQTILSKKHPKPWKGILELRGVYLGWLVLSLAALATAVAFASPRPLNSAQRLHPECTAQVVFVLATIACYSLAYGWYRPIGRGDRFMLSLYAPMVLSVVWAGESLLRRARRRGAGKWIFVGYHFAQWLLVAAVVWRLVQILRFPLFRS